MTADERLEALTRSLELFERHTRERMAQFEREQDAVRERQARIEDNMIVQGELVARLEQRVDLLVTRIDDYIEHTNDYIDQTKAWINSAENRLAKLQGARLHCSRTAGEGTECGSLLPLSAFELARSEDD
jgi:hypothetical protein